MNPAIRHKYPNRKRRRLRLGRVSGVAVLFFACAATIFYIFSGKEERPEPQPSAQGAPPAVVTAPQGGSGNTLPASAARPAAASRNTGAGGAAQDGAARPGPQVPASPPPPSQGALEPDRPTATPREIQTALDALAQRPVPGAPFAGHSLEQTAALLAGRYAARTPAAWGEHLPGVTSSLVPEAANGPVMALTLDACGGKKGASYDAELIAFLRERNIPATLFVTSLWMRNNPEALADLAADPLFEIAAHGSRHRPCSVNGNTVYGIKGTASFAELVAEVEGNARDIETATGKRPRWFRAGTAYYDDVAIQVIRDLGLSIAGYSVAGDQGATLSAAKVAAKVRAAKNGDILLLHMNKPRSGTRDGLKLSLPELVERGTRFIRLSDMQ